MDRCAGQLLDAVAELEIEDNTIFIFSSDNGPEDTRAWRGWTGPWSGSYVTAMECSLRVLFLIRWPNKIPGVRVSNEIVREADVYTTRARIVGAEIPANRSIDGMDQTASLLGEQEHSAPEWFPTFLGTELYCRVAQLEGALHQARARGRRPAKTAIPKMFNLYTNPQERSDENLETTITHGWVLHAMFKLITAFQESSRKHPPIPIGTPDPYTP